MIRDQKTHVLLELNNGTYLPESNVTRYMQVLTRLHDNHHYAFCELTKLSRNPEYIITDMWTESFLLNCGILEAFEYPAGAIKNNLNTQMRQVILSAVSGVVPHLFLGSPYMIRHVSTLTTIKEEPDPPAKNKCWWLPMYRANANADPITERALEEKVWWLRSSLRI